MLGCPNITTALTSLEQWEDNMTHEHPDQPAVSSGAQSLPKGVHLVGSVPLSSAEEVFRTTSSILRGLPKIKRSSPLRLDGVVPFTMKGISRDVEGSQFFISDLEASGVEIAILDGRHR